MSRYSDLRQAQQNKLAFLFSAYCRAKYNCILNGGKDYFKYIPALREYKLHVSRYVRQPVPNLYETYYQCKIWKWGPTFLSIWCPTVKCIQNFIFRILHLPAVLLFSISSSTEKPHRHIIGVNLQTAAPSKLDGYHLFLFTAVPCILILSSLIYPTECTTRLKFTLKWSYMFRLTNHHQEAYCCALLKLCLLK